MNNYKEYIKRYMEHNNIKDVEVAESHQMCKIMKEYYEGENNE